MCDRHRSRSRSPRTGDLGYGVALEEVLETNPLDSVPNVIGHALEPGADPWSVVDFCELDDKERPNFLRGARKKVRVFRAQAPVGRQGVLGSDGLNLREAYHMHPVAVERGGKVSFNIRAETRLRVGEFLWFGIDESTASQSNASVKLMKLFLNSDNLNGVRSGELPVFSWHVPVSWQQKTVVQLDLEREYGITVVGWECDGHTTFFPPLDAPMPNKHCEMFMSISSSMRFMEARLQCIQKRGNSFMADVSVT